MLSYCVLLLLPLALANPVPHAEFAVGSAEDHEVLKQLVVDLFTDRENREIDIDADGEGGEDSLNSADVVDAAIIGKPKPVEDPAEIARFNNYMDAVYRRMNAAVRAKMMDPMTLNLSQDNADKKADTKKAAKKNEKTKKSARTNKKNNKRKSRNLSDEADAVEDEEAEDVEDAVDSEGEGRKMQDAEKKGKKGNKEKKEKKVKKVKKEKKDKKEKDPNKSSERKAAKAEKKRQKQEAKQVKKGNKNKKHNKDETAAEKKHERQQKRREGKGKKNNNNKAEKDAAELARSKRAKHSKEKKVEKEGKKAIKEKKDDFSGKSMGSLAGIATLRRSGDVILLDGGDYKTVKSDFSIGPLQLEVSKTFGSGKSRSVKSAKAVTEKLVGRITLKVKPDGSAHVKSVSFKKPEQVEIRGSLSEQKKRSDKYLKNSVGRIRPMAAQRLLKMARYVLKSPATAAATAAVEHS